MRTQKTITRGVAAFIFLIIIGYAYFEAREYLSGPQLLITEPEDGFVTTESPLRVMGEAHNITEILLNGNPIFVDENGAFQRLVPLALGYSVIEIAVKDRFGREKKLSVRGTYEPAETPFPLIPAASATGTPDDLDDSATTTPLY